MKKLNNSEHNKVVSLLKENCGICPTFAYSVVDNIISGSIYVDDLVQPTTVFVYTNIGVYFIGGNVGNSDFNTMFFNFCMQEIKNNRKRFTLFSGSNEWDKVINHHLKGKIRKMHRFSYEFNSKKCQVTPKNIPYGFTLQKINERSIELSTEFTKDYYEQYWGDISKFLNYGLGYCIRYNEMIVSECTSIFIGNSFVEIDIATKTEFVGKGFATILGKAFIEKCLVNGLIPSWDCDVENVSSIKLAEKLGFDNPAKYSIFVKSIK